MTNQQINEAIAKVCGWTRREHNLFTGWLPPGAIAFEVSMPPDFCNDLNAMHEAEQRLTEDQCKDYYYRLVEVQFGTKSAYRLISPKASERATAFLMAIGKWRNE